MQKIEKLKAGKSSIPSKTARFSSYDEKDDSDFDHKSYNPKLKVNCICPKCGEQHVVAFHWIGRGAPRKYCLACKAAAKG